MFIKKIFAFFLLSISTVAAHAQAPPGPVNLIPGRAAERTIAGGESHTYQITLAAGQFMRVMVEQTAIDAALKIETPDGKQLITNFGDVGELESLSAEAAAGGEYRLTISARGAAGSYQLRLEVRAAPTAQDKLRLDAERLLNEAGELFDQGAAATLEPTIEKALQALRLWHELGDRHWEAATANFIGQAYGTAGTSEREIEYYSQALNIRRDLKYRTGEGITLLNLGSAYYRLGRYEKAIEYYAQSLAIFRELHNRLAEGNALYNLGIAHSKIGGNAKAIEYYEQSLAIQREVKNRRVEGRALGSIGTIYRNLRRYDTAIEHHDEALAISREVQDRSGEGYALSNLSLDYSKMGRYEKAIEYGERSLAVFRELKQRNGEAAALYSLANSERARGSLLAAHTYIEENLRLEEAARASILTPASRTSFLAGMQSSYRLFTDILMNQHKAEPTKGFDALALETSERQRARGLLDLLGEARVDLRQGVDATLIERERSVGQQLNDKARAETATPEQAAALKREISQLENDYEEAQAAIRKASPNYAALVQPQPLKLTQVKDQLDGDTVLLEYSLGDPGQDLGSSYLWAVTRDSLTTYELPKVELIEKSAREVYELLTARSTNKPGETAIQRQERISDAEAKLPNAAKELSQIILAPVAAQLGRKRLIIVADGALQYIPFAMLPDPATGGTQPLIVGHEVVSLPSASSLVFQRTELAGRQPAPKMLAVIADPVFDRSDTRFKKTAPDDKAVSQSGMPADTRGLEHITESADAKSGRLVIRRLPFTRQEADALLALTSKNSSFKAIDFQANRRNVLNGDLSQYKYVHFATHGVMDAQRPGLSSLVLSTVDAEGKPQNGFLRANDIYNMKLPAELVVLSACQTGLGKEVKGEGLIGLTRGFMYAGAKRVVVSLWSVNDKATSDLMTKFYRGMLKDNVRPAAALRAAQIEMWKQKKWQSPYYWAAFTMQGEWR